jgi:hypothetical protein
MELPIFLRPLTIIARGKHPVDHAAVRLGVKRGIEALGPTPRVNGPTEHRA